MCKGIRQLFQDIKDTQTNGGFQFHEPTNNQYQHQTKEDENWRRNSEDTITYKHGIMTEDETGSMQSSCYITKNKPTSFSIPVEALYGRNYLVDQWSTSANILYT